MFCRLMSIAEETLAEFLSKATGTAVEWVQMPGMKVTTAHFAIIIPIILFHCEEKLTETV
jgi:hypothetical protein